MVPTFRHSLAPTLLRHVLTKHRAWRVAGVHPRDVLAVLAQPLSKIPAIETFAGSPTFARPRSARRCRGSQHGASAGKSSRSSPVRSVPASFPIFWSETRRCAASRQRVPPCLRRFGMMLGRVSCGRLSREPPVWSVMLYRFGDSHEGGALSHRGRPARRRNPDGPLRTRLRAVRLSWGASLHRRRASAASSSPVAYAAPDRSHRLARLGDVDIRRRRPVGSRPAAA